MDVLTIVSNNLVLVEEIKKIRATSQFFKNELNVDYAWRMLKMGDDALVKVSALGDVNRMKSILNWPDNAPKADCRKGWALVKAAEYGHIDAMRLLLEWPENAPKAKCRNGWALMHAAENGHIEAIRLLLKWPENAPKADCQDGWAL
eukprot:357641-Chlamydomonas_euryale.AAC.3